MNLTVVERKILGALIANCNAEGHVSISKRKIAHAIGYKEMGGIITYAITGLEFKNYIAKLGKSEYLVLL